MITILSKIKRLILLVCALLSLSVVNAAFFYGNVGKPVLSMDCGTLIAAGMLWDVPGGEVLDYNKHGINFRKTIPYYMSRFAYKGDETVDFGVDLYEEITGVPDVYNVVDSCLDKLFEQGQQVRITNKFLVNGGTSVAGGTVLTSADFGFETWEPNVSIGGGTLCGAKKVNELQDGPFIVYAEYLSQFKDYCDTAGYTVTKTITDVSLYMEGFSYLYTHVCDGETDEVKEQIGDAWLHSPEHNSGHQQCQKVTGSIDDWVYMAFVKNSVYARHAIEFDYNTQKTVKFRRISNDDAVDLIIVTISKDGKDPGTGGGNSSSSSSSSANASVEIDYEKLTQALTDALNAVSLYVIDI